MKPPLRTKSVGTKVSEAEFALLEERARGAGMRLAEWVREALMSAPVNSGPDSGEVALGEILALRSLLVEPALPCGEGRSDPGAGDARADRAGGRNEDAAGAGASGDGAGGSKSDRAGS
jgi:hypothetical protein